MTGVIRQILLTLLVAASATTFPSAQPQRPQATLTPVVVSKEIVAGGEARLDLQVVLPPNVHVQANELTDPFFIPTVLTIDAPKGISVQEIVYPPSETLKQAGVSEPLVVFGSKFVLRVRLKLSGDVSAGELSVPGRLRYQACDETQCYPPARADATWTVRVAPPR